MKRIVSKSDDLSYSSRGAGGSVAFPLGRDVPLLISKAGIVPLRPDVEPVIAR